MSINNCGNIYGVDIDTEHQHHLTADPYTLIENPSEMDCDGDCRGPPLRQLEKVEEAEEQGCGIAQVP